LKDYKDNIISLIISKILPTMNDIYVILVWSTYRKMHRFKFSFIKENIHNIIGVSRLYVLLSLTFPHGCKATLKVYSFDKVVEFVSKSVPQYHSATLDWIVYCPLYPKKKRKLVE